MSVLPYGVIYLLPIVVACGALLGGWFNFMTPIFVFGLVPAVDLIWGRNRRNPTAEEEATIKDSLGYRRLTYLSVPVQLLLLGWGTHLASSGRLSAIEWVGLAISVGISGGAMGINLSHEMIHRGQRLETLMGKTLLWAVSYLHWSIEHLAGHHRTVATPDDPATARLGESFYSFWPRTVVGGFRSAWKLEGERLTRLKQVMWGPRNRILRYVLATVALTAGLGVIWGPWAVVFFLLQSLVAFSLLEAVNYLEHYGLRRRKKEDGTYEKVTPVHSWNASERMTNYFLFNLQRHSDHHAHPGRRYQILRHMEEAPQLPTGYAAMVPLVLVPPLWFRVMDHRVPQHMKEMAESPAPPA